MISRAISLKVAHSVSKGTSLSLFPSLSLTRAIRSCARTVGDIHHRATNFRDKYFTDGHYAGAACSCDINYGWLWRDVNVGVGVGVGFQGVEPKGLTPVKFAGTP